MGNKLDLNRIKVAAKESIGPGDWNVKIPKSSFDALISEVERLEGHLTRNTKMYQELRDNLSEQIDSLTKERDELNKEIKRINNIKHGWAKKSRRIRAENAELKREIEEERKWVDHTSEKNNKLKAENAELKATVKEMSESHRRQQQRVGRGPEY